MSAYFGEISSARQNHPMEYPDLVLAHNTALGEFISKPSQPSCTSAPIIDALSQKYGHPTPRKNRNFAAPNKGQPFWNPQGFASQLQT
ncbi:hypothetical protein [Gloeomargarita sp.]